MSKILKKSKKKIKTKINKEEEDAKPVEKKPFPPELQRTHLRLEFKKKIICGETIEVRPESPPEVKKDDRRGRAGKREQKHDESKDESKDVNEEEEVDYTEKWKNDIISLKNFNVVKMKRVLQSIFYFLKYQREDICEEKTNLLNWKKAKVFINDDFFDRIKNYNPYGPKEDEYTQYQKLNFIIKNLEEIRQEDVDAYSLSVGQLLQYMNIAIELRRTDIIKRYQHKTKLKEERALAEEQENDRQTERANFLEEERGKWEEEQRIKLEEKQKAKEAEGENDDDDEAEGEGDKQQQEEEQFDENEALARFDTDRPPIEIPPVVIDDIDNDYELTEDDMNPVQE